MIIYLHIIQGDLEDDANVPDRESSIKPRHHHSKTHSQQHEHEVTILTDLSFNLCVYIFVE